MTRPKLPSGAEMWNKSEKVKTGVMWLLKNRPSTKGCDRATIWFYWKYYDGWDPYKPTTMKIFRRLTSSETIRRRRQEIQNAKNLDGSWKNPELRPSLRTNIKRGVRREAVSNYYGAGYKQMDLVDIGVVLE